MRYFAVAEWSKALRLGRSKHPPQSLWLFVGNTVCALQMEPFRPVEYDESVVTEMPYLTATM